MLRCTICQHDNTPDSVYCSHCGALLDSSTLAQKPILPQSSPAPMPQEVKKQLGLNEDRTYFGNHSRVVLLAREYPAPVEFSMSYESGVILGRASSRPIEKRLVDLTVFGAYKYGVSRVHAELVLRGHSLRLIDLDSTNGTYVNGRQLLPREQCGLSSGDTLQLGNLVMRVVFRHPD
ncbi:MAG: FHA domain-containing protein [Anaerolineae bacterium]|nr:FHA domain-containing protein [Anaerolineae bacterium]